MTAPLTAAALTPSEQRVIKAIALASNWNAGRGVTRSTTTNEAAWYASRGHSWVASTIARRINPDRHVKRSGYLAGITGNGYCYLTDEGWAVAAELGVKREPGEGERLRRLDPGKEGIPLAKARRMMHHGGGMVWTGKDEDTRFGKITGLELKAKAGMVLWDDGTRSTVPLADLRSF